MSGPVFCKMEKPSTKILMSENQEIGKPKKSAGRKPSGVFMYRVPVYVTLVDGWVDEVHVADETSFEVCDCELIEGRSLAALVRAANDCSDWPSWEFGW
jgi:hypothetical protein